MLDKLIVRHYPLPETRVIPHESGAFVLATCQRTLVVRLGSSLGKVEGSDFYLGSDGYSLLLEVICGLKSSIIGETEIVQQFKKCYREYIDRPDRDSTLMRVLERLFKDAKKVRADHLLTVGGRSYASICKKIIKRNSSQGKILVVGSGALAKDIVKQCSKEFEIYLSARNDDAVDELASHSKVTIVPWGDNCKWKSYSCIISTIGAQKILFDEEFFGDWKSVHQKRALFVDLGSPSTIETIMTEKDGVFRLSDVLSFAKESERHNQRFVTDALGAISSISKYRVEYFRTIGKRSMLAVVGDIPCQNLE
ncbi:MAG: hypothetical protein KAG61_11810 [Bacteriovoracaceae bacterium]|nr:hypothetical protein [Bacteriovoracaceae bacterium]